MDTPTKRTAPTGILLAMALACCWPYLDEEAGFVDEPGAPVKLVRSWFTPDVGTQLDSDPFAVAAAPARELPPEVPQPAPKPRLIVRTPPKQTPKPTPPKPTPKPTPKPPPVRPQVAPQPPKQTPPPVPPELFTDEDGKTVLAEFRLSGVWLAGDNQFAVVNDRVRQPGDRIGRWGPGQHPITVRGIHNDHVLLAVRDTTLKLRPAPPRKKQPEPTQSEPESELHISASRGFSSPRGNPAASEPEASESEANEPAQSSTRRLLDLLFRSARKSEELQRASGEMESE